MIRINLLPVRTSRKRETALRQIVLAAAGLVLVAAGCAYLYVDLESKITDTTTQNAKIQQEITQLKQVIGKVEEFEARKKELEKKLDIILTLKHSKTGPVHLLDEIASNIPDKCWLTSLSERDKKIEITGMSINNEVISDFITKLESSDYFDDVYLVTTKATESKDGIKLKEFSVTARMIASAVKTKKGPSQRSGNSEGQSKG